MDEKTLLSTVGELKFKRYYYLDKYTGGWVHLLDKVIGIKKQRRQKSQNTTLIVDKMQ